MIIDLTKPGGATSREVGDLLASKDDSENRQLRVDVNGRAYISDNVGSENIGNVLYRFETWAAGCGYCGLKAASDSEYVEHVRDDLNRNWPKPKSSYIDG